VTLYIDDNGTFREWDGVEKIGGLSYQPNIGDMPESWTDEALGAIGLYKPVVPEVQAGKVVVASTVQRVNGVVTFVYELASVPLADLNRIQFEFMIEKLGLSEAITQAIEAMPENDELEQNAKILARVLFRSGQKFERAHPLFTTLAPAVGFTTEQIDAAWLVALTI
jgi:hypothetical protein